jgi:3-phenylpropionate/cinnamic acid dioxygenase small subunit|uniref:Aromatic-ring-hydroxylating dioxygenase beta subunit n=1 Tax=Caulobacter sp. (strain K31) TaxID=366602 RepID=B0T5U5_CAUSK
MDPLLLEPTPLPPSVRAKRLRADDPVYLDVLDFLYDEAEMLDNLEFKAWAKTLAPDLEYNVPIRHTRPARQVAQTVVRTVQHMHDDYGSIMLRIARMTETRSAWGEDPPSRTRRLVTNIRVYRTEKADEFKVQSYQLVTRSRFDFDYFDLIPCERHDVLRRADGELHLARREIIIDQAVIGTPNLGIFL